MRVASVVATALVPKRVVFGLAALLLAAVICFAIVHSRCPQAVLGSQSYQLETATTPAAWQQGLSGRPELSPYHGMLFVFRPASKDCFWMKDMHFSLDIIWLDSGRNVVHIKSNATPVSYPQQFCPPAPARYVLEVPAGTILTQHVSIGQSVTLKGI